MEHDQVARHGVFMATQDGRFHGLSALPDERSPDRKRSLTRTNLTFLTGATNRLFSPIIERSFLGRCCRNGTQLNDFWRRRSATAALETQFLKSHFHSPRERGCSSARASL